MLTMSARPDGFEITFTYKVAPSTAGEPASYEMSAWTYIHQSGYVSPQADKVIPKVTAAKVVDDGKSVRLTVEDWVKGHVHQLDAKNLKSTDGTPLWHPTVWFTLNEIPSR